jgi:dolichol kinase
MFFIGGKGYIAKNHYGSSSTIVSGFFFIFFGVYNLFFGIFPHPVDGFMLWWIGIVVIINLTFSLIIRKELKKIGLEQQYKNNFGSESHKKSPLRKFIELMTRENPYQECISLKMEAIRKSFHLSGILMILAFFGFFFIPPLTQMVNQNVIGFINDTKWLYKILWGDPNKYPYKDNDFQSIIGLTMFAIFGSLFFAIIPDIIRVLLGPEYSMLNFLTKSVLRNKEYNSIGPQIFLLIGVSFSYMLFLMGLIHFLVAFTGIVIGCFSDAIAALVGRFYGKNKVKCIGGDIKSVEGFLAGTLSAFIVGLILLGPIYALIAALVFFLLDYFPTVIADNILNPILVILGISIGILFLGLPIGWI